MGVRWLVLVVATMAACDDSIYIEVRSGDRAIDEVELVVGAEQCTDGGTPCDGVAPPGFALRYPGKVYFHDPQDFQTPLVQKPDSNGVAWFKLAASAATVRTIAVGKLGDQPRSAVLLDEISLLSGPLHVITELAPTIDLAGTVHDHTGFAAWATQAGETCIGAENTNAMDVGRGAAAFIVPQTDTDCDDVRAELECDPFAYLATQVSDPGALLCVSHFPIANANSPSACMLGATSCDEQSPTGTGCIRANTCVPDAACNACTDPIVDPTCLVQSLLNANTRLVCSIEVLPGLLPGEPFTLCDAGSGSIATFTDDARFGRSCTDVPRIGLPDQMPPFDTRITFDTGMGHSLTVAPIDLATKCQFDLKLDGDVDAGSGDTPLLGVIDLMLEGTQQTSAQDVLLALELRFAVSNCLKQSSCQLIPANTDDSVFNCIGGK